MENTSGHGEYAVVPKEVKGWNWGAFWLTWIWGLFNGAYIALLALIPVVNIIMAFYLGFKGNELSWRNKIWYEVEDFHKSQKKWAIWGWIIAAIVISASVNREVGRYREGKISNQLANESITIIMNDEKAREYVGNDIAIEFMMGRTGVGTNYGTTITGINFIIKSENGMFHVTSSLKNETEITKVVLDKFDGNNSQGNEVVIEVITK